MNQSSNDNDYNINNSIDLQNSIQGNTLKSYIHQSLQSIHLQQTYAPIIQDAGSQSFFQQPHLNKRLPKDNFLQCFQQQTIIQFYDAYLPLIQLNPYLQKIQKIYQFYHRQVFKNNHDSIITLPMPYTIQEQLDQLIDNVREILLISEEKYQHFLKFKLAAVLYDWKQLIQVLLEISQSNQSEIQIKTQDKSEKRHYIKQIIKVIYTNLRYMIDYIMLNEETFYFLRKDLTKYLLPRMDFIKNQIDEAIASIGNLSNIRRNLKSQIQRTSFTYKLPTLAKFRTPSYRHIIKQDKQLQSIQQKQDFQSYSNSNQNQVPNLQRMQQANPAQKIVSLFVFLNSSKLPNCRYKHLFYCLQSASKMLYSSLVYHNIQKTHKLQCYSIINKKIQSHKNHFLMGLYIGLGSITLLALMILLVFNLVQLDYDDKRIDSMNYVFPVFRGIGLLILYLWGMAWNVYGFTKYRINHRLVLQYGSHYSTHFQIMKRAGFFTLIFTTMLLVYCVVQSLTKANYLNQNSNLVQYSPFIVWVLFFSYIFFPNRDVFNPKGRRYFYDILKKIIFSPAMKITFLITWASDQAVSFVIPFKDFAYTICFYTSDLSLSSVKDCLNSSHIQGVLVTYVAAILPLLLRMVQCYRLAIQNSGKFVGHIQFWNFFKYFSSVITASVSYLTTIQSSFLPVFIVSSIISTSYSYYWDLKNDWGFLQEKPKYRFLRNQLSYKNPNYYYLAIAINLVFRCSWTLTISPSIVTYLHKSTFLPFLTGFIQILRRCIWNFFRIQKQHLVNCKDYVIMRPDVQKIIQKIKKKQRQRTAIFQIHQQSFLGYSKQIKQSFIQRIKQQQNLSQFFGKDQYQKQWSDMNHLKVMQKKKQYLDFLQKQNDAFFRNNKILKQKHQYLYQSIY